MSTLLNWIDDRTGLGQAVKSCRQATIPGRVCLCHVWPSALVFTFAVQVVTGLVLLMFYSPSAQTAWESVYYLQHEVQGGWLLQAVHHYAGQALLVLVGLYLIQMIVLGAYRAPREFVFWTVVLMGLVVLGLLLTGDLLAWDQNSQSCTKVRTEFLMLLPVVGGDLFKLAAGGPEFGHLTLTRFLGLHVGVLAGGFLLLLLLHAWFGRRASSAQGKGAGKGVGNLLPERPEGCSAQKVPDPFSYFWPNQALLNVVIWLLVLVVVGLPAVFCGVPLGAPADPGGSYAAARPEWAFLGLYGFANLFPGELKILPIFVIPGLLVCLFLLMPFIGRMRFGHWFNILLVLVLLVGNGVLSYMMLAKDRHDDNHQAALEAGQEEADRIKQLVRGPQGIPVDGALALLANDPKTQGPKLYKQHCASCHDYTDAEGRGIEAEEPSAPNLHDYAARPWIAGWLKPKKITGPHYLGKTELRKGEMVDFVKEMFSDLDDDEKKEVESIVISLSAQARLPSQRAQDEKDAERIEEGRQLLLEDYGCVDCHKFHGKGRLGDAPDLTGYGSRQWTIAIIANPADKRFYGERNDHMPAYAENPNDPAANILSDRQIGLLADWLRGEWYEPGEGGR